jgi:type III pantothenate kinase
MTTYTLLFDVGNTQIKLCTAARDALGPSFALSSAAHESSDAIGLRIESVLRHQRIDPDRIEACVASSVVPALTQSLRRACRRFFDKQLLLAPEDIPIPLENRYARPAEVGSDRLVGAFAARCLLPDAPSIISVDYGTATTFDCVSGNAYLGGLICPGVLSSLAALASRTAKLPHIGLEVDTDGPLVGQSTATSINHGFVFGFAAMTEGLVARLAADMTGPVTVIATGGFARSLAGVISCFDVLRPDLLLEGLRALYYGRPPS